MHDTGYITIFITVGSEKEAEEIGKVLVEEKLIACVNIISGIRSIFHWEGKICDEEELLLIAKSKESLFQKIKERTIELHSYDVPEIIALPIPLGSEEYLKWIDEVTLNEE